MARNQKVLSRDPHSAGEFISCPQRGSSGFSCCEFRVFRGKSTGGIQVQG